MSRMEARFYARVIAYSRSKLPIHAQPIRRRHMMKKHLSQGILGDQSGQDTLEWIAIAAVVVIIVIVVFAIIRDKAIEKAEAIW